MADIANSLLKMGKDQNKIQQITMISMATSLILYGLYNVTITFRNKKSHSEKKLQLKEIPSPSGSLPYFGRPK